MSQKNDLKKEFRMERVKENENLQICLTLFLLACPYGIVSKYFYLNFRKGSSKKFPECCDYRVGRRKEPILGYVPKNDEKIIQDDEG